MYQYQGLRDIIFIMLYGGAAMLAVVACLYLLLRRSNVVAPGIHSPLALRRWAAAFMTSIVMSHVWWVVLGVFFLTDDRPLRNAVAIGLDSVTLVPCMMATLLSLLQDRRRPLWPVAASMLPVVVTVIVLGIIMRSELYEPVMQVYLLILATTFIIYMVYAVRQYGRWLHDNYADLEHKEVWQSLVLLAIILLMFVGYKTNYGGLFSEYVTQLNTLVIIIFLVWRVETLQQLTQVEEPVVGVSDLRYIGGLLEQQCEEGGLYLQHDLTLQQLATAIGTNRTYLSTYFAQTETTYNAYINLLRIEHFERLYLRAKAISRPVTAQQLASESGCSYSTFSTAFKKYRGITVAAWMQGVQTDKQISEFTKTDSEFTKTEATASLKVSNNKKSE